MATAAGHASASALKSLAGSRSVGNVVTLAKHRMSPTFAAWRLNSGQLRMDPWLNVDHFEMSTPVFPPHPHAGFSAVTYLFDDSPGSIINRDSHGSRNIIRPGGVHWTTAASGIVHEEVPESVGTLNHGLQVFANLDSESKTAQPVAQHVDAADMPTYETPGGGRVKIISGSSGGLDSPLKLLTPMTFLDVKLPGGASFTHALPRGHNATVLVFSGEVAFGPSGQVVRAEQACDFEGDGDALAGVNGQAGGAEAHFVVLEGKPLRIPVVWSGPFCGDSQQQVAGWMLKYRAGGMGTLTPFYG